jgi:hypothetical protein
VLAPLARQLAGRCLTFDVDWLLDAAGALSGGQPARWPAFRDAWLAVAHGVALTRTAAGSYSHPLDVTLRPGGRAALKAVTTRAAGHHLAIIVAGRAWEIADVQDGPLTAGRFEILLSASKQASRLMQLLGQSG